MCDRTPVSQPHELRAGHKGLFFDRLDGGIVNVTTGADTPRLVSGARLSGYARNRTLHTTLGRWSQPDPNATGLAVQTSIGYHGVAPAARVQPFSLAAHFTDGPNVYAYLDNSTWTRSDPTGLMTVAELGGVSGVQGMLGALLRGAAAMGPAVQATTSALMVRGGIWAVNMTASGALVVGYNATNVMMLAQEGNARSGEFYDPFDPNTWNVQPPPEERPGRRTASEQEMARHFGVSRERIGKAIHELKDEKSTSGRLRNADIEVDLKTGDAFIRVTNEHIGNIKQSLGI